MAVAASITCTVICVAILLQITIGARNTQNEQSKSSMAGHGQDPDLIFALQKGKLEDVRKFVRAGALEAYLAGNDKERREEKLRTFHRKLRTVDELLTTGIAFNVGKEEKDKFTFKVTMLPETELTTTMRINSTALRFWGPRRLKGGKRPLHLVCQLPDIDVDVVGAVLDMGLDDINVKTDNGATPLVFAAASRSFDVVRFLVEKGAKLNDYATVTIGPSDQADYPYAKLFSTKEVDMSETNVFHYSPLVAAAWEGDKDILKFLIDRGANASQNWGILFNPAIQGRKKIVEILIENGVDINTRDLLGSTALHKVSEEGLVEQAKLLIQLGANVNAADNFGFTPLHLAALFSKAETVELLVNAGSYIMAKSEGGTEPLNMAVAGGSVDFLKYLIERFNTLNTTSIDHSGAPAVKSDKHVGVVDFLIGKGAPYNSQDNIFGWSPLHWAAASGDLKVAKKLVQLGAVISTKSKTGLNPLKTAELFKRRAVSDFLKTAKDLVH